MNEKIELNSPLDVVKYIKPGRCSYDKLIGYDLNAFTPNTMPILSNKCDKADITFVIADEYNHTITGVVGGYDETYNGALLNDLGTMNLGKLVVYLS